MAGNTSQHILNASANLLGFCLFVITSLHITDKTESGFIDELTSIIAILLTITCILSFSSIRMKEGVKAQQIETAADYIFMTALSGILIVILMIAFNFI